MTKKWMRSISVLLSVLMLLAVFSPMAYAIQVDAPAGDEKVLMNLDFASFKVGETPKGPDGFDSPLNASKDVARMYVEMDGDNPVLKCYHGAPEGDRARQPRVEKIFTTVNLTNMTISYRVKSSGGASKVDLAIMEGGTNNPITFPGTPSDFKEWTEIKVVLNVTGNKLDMYVDGKPRTEGKVIAISDKESIGIRLSGVVEVDGSWVMVDDFKVTTTDKDYKLVPEGPYNEIDEKPESGELLYILKEDFEAQEVGKGPSIKAVGGFTGYAINDAARMYVELDADGNKILKAYHGAPDLPDAAPRTPRVDRMLTLNGITTLTLDLDMKNSGGATRLPEIRLIHDVENSPIYVALQPTAETTDWIHVKVRFDVANGVAKMYVNGRLQAEKTFDLQGIAGCRLRILDQVQLDGSWAAIDNVVITTPNVDAGGLVAVDGATVNWSKVSVSEENKTGYMEMMRQTHPRVYVTDWQEIRNRVETDPHVKKWADNVIQHANNMLARAPIEYYRNLRNNINDCSTDFKTSIVAVAMAYCLTGDARYKDRVYLELENVGNWPDWGSDAFLCTAHILFAFGVCYDWLYNDLTPEQRANITGWIRDKGFNESILFYEGFSKGTNFPKAESNWNQVCNGSNIVAAIAFANELPEVADYILYRAAESLPNSYAEISPDGAYAEPISYWDYGMRHLVKAMAALDSALLPGYTLPTVLDFSLVPGVSNTGDFPVYYNGAREAFDYGDGFSTLVDSPILFYLADKFNKPQYGWYMNNLWDNNPAASTVAAQDAALSILWYNPEKSSLPEGGFALDKYYESHEKHGTNGISMRSSWEDDNGLIVMMRGGDQMASHAALDAGGFVLDWNAKRWVYMHSRNPVPNIPGGTYSWPGFHSKTETGGHYDYYHCRGEANNTIIANPKQDMPDMNIKYYSAMERYESGEGTAYGILDTTDTNLDYETAKRGMVLTNNRSMVVLQDEITAKMPSEFYWFVNTEADITIAPDGKSALWEWDGDKMLVRITQGPADATFGVMPTQPLPTSPDPEIQPDIPEHKMFIHMQNCQKLNLTVEFVPLREGEGVPAPLANWSLEGDAKRPTSTALGSIVALKVDNPNAYAKGAKTYVDTANLDIKPIVQNGRTLVPVRFISENIGAKVGWNDVTQTVSITTANKAISLQIGSATMMVDGNAITLDVPAQTIGGRTLIPLRALVEALGKQVFWDDRGLILITDEPVAYDAAKIDAIIDLLDIRVQADGKEIKFFDSEVYNYNVEIAKGAAIPTLSVLSDKEATVTQGNPATVTVGGKVYTFNFVENPFEGLLGTGSAGVANTIKVAVDNVGALPSYQTYLTIQSATSSIEFTEDKYPMNGTYDGVISEDTINRWSANGLGSWICYDFGEVKNLHSLAISGYKAISRSYIYDVEVSTDGVNFTKVCAAETPKGVDHDVFALGDVQARYVRLTCTLSSNSTWAGISEVRFYESAQMQVDDQNAWDAYFYTAAINALAGTKTALNVQVFDKLGTQLPIDPACIAFTSSKPDVATVDANGNITLLKAGSATIRVEYKTLAGMAIALIPVTVE